MSERPTIALTDAAAQHIAAILKRHKDSIGFRLSVKKMGCSGYQYVPTVIEKETEGDIRIDTTQGIIIFVDSLWMGVLGGTTIDVVKEDFGQKKLIYRNPKVEDECGCGESFALKKNGNE